MQTEERSIREMREQQQPGYSDNRGFGGTRAACHLRASRDRQARKKIAINGHSFVQRARFLPRLVASYTSATYTPGVIAWFVRFCPVDNSDPLFALPRQLPGFMRSA